MKKKNRFSLGRIVINKAKENTYKRIEIIANKRIRKEEKINGALINDEKDAIWEETYSKYYKRIYKEEKSKAKRELGLKVALASIGITATIGVGTKMLMPLQNPNTKPNNEVSTNIDTDEKDESKDFKGQYKVNESSTINEKPTVELSTEEKENIDSNVIINSIISSYNEKYDTNYIEPHINLSDKNSFYNKGYHILETSVQYYISENENGEYTFDRFGDSSASISSGTIYSIIDQSNQIIFSVGKYYEKGSNVPVYKVTDARIVMDSKRNDYSAAHEKGNYLTSNDIYIDDDLVGAGSNIGSNPNTEKNAVGDLIKENVSREKALYNACSHELEKCIADIEKSKQSSSLQK